MKKITGKELEVKVNGSQITFYKDSKKVAQTNYFNNKEIQGGKVIVRFDCTWGEMKKFTGTALSLEQYQEVVDYIAETQKEIDTYFENVTNLELQLLSNGNIALIKTEEQKALDELNHEYFYNVTQEWIRENKKYFTSKNVTNKTEIGTIETTTVYNFTKENIEKVEERIAEYKQTEEYKVSVERANRNIRLEELAQKMNDDDFEDITGLPRENYIG